MRVIEGWSDGKAERVGCVEFLIRTSMCCDDLFDVAPRCGWHVYRGFSANKHDKFADAKFGVPVRIFYKPVKGMLMACDIEYL